MTLTKDQQKAVESGQAVIVDLDGTPCILVRKDVFERQKPLDYSETSPEESFAAVESAWGDEPGLDAYQDYK